MRQSGRPSAKTQPAVGPSLTRSQLPFTSSTFASAVTVLPTGVGARWSIWTCMPTVVSSGLSCPEEASCLSWAVLTGAPRLF